MYYIMTKSQNNQIWSVTQLLRLDWNDQEPKERKKEKKKNSNKWIS